MLREMFAEWRRDGRFSMPKPSLLVEQFPRDGVEVVQVDDRFRIAVSSRQEVPADDEMAAYLVANRLCLQDAVANELGSVMNDGDLHLGGLGVG